MTSHGASSKKISGLSRAAIRHGFHGSSRRSQVLVAGKQTHRMEEAAVKRQMQLQGTLFQLLYYFAYTVRCRNVIGRSGRS